MRSGTGCSARSSTRSTGFCRCCAGICSRLPDESFLIYDAAHGTALLHRDGQVHYLAMERYIPGTDETELDWQRMWKRFFKALTIEQRRDEKAQMTHVPKRFWQDMCEMQADLL